jgi:outer membrane murein-binding lipoprotein Lpp
MKLMKIMGVAALSGMLLAGCASVAHVEKDETVNFSNYKTFAWAEKKTEKGDSARTVVSDLTEKAIKEAVTAELVKAGWRESKKPDVMLAYDVVVEKSLRQVNDPQYTRPFTRFFYSPYTGRWIPVYYPSQFWGYNTREEQVKEGTVTISLIDSRTEKTVWQGWTTEEINSRNITKKEIQNSVKSIFKKFDLVKN